MRAIILFLLICTFVKKYHAKNMSRILEMQQYLCPFANFCSENYTIPHEDLLNGLGSCCTECSCMADCEDKGNCCFPSKVPYTIDNEISDYTLQHRRSCIYPTTLEKTKNEYQAYYMITSVFSDRTKYSSLSCGDIKVAEWGSIYPVYSPKRKQIYKNIACATADGITDGKTWDVRLSCNHYISYYKEFRDLMAFRNPMHKSDFMDCHIDFIYRGYNEQIQKHKCYRDVINVCPTSSSFNITDEIGLISRKEIVVACTSGLVSPFLFTKTYANVFCHLCNEETFATEMQCKRLFGSNLLSASSVSSFSGLIDAEVFLREVQANGLKIKQKVPTACRIYDKESCRPIYCPSGQLYDRFGRCKYVVRLWYKQSFDVLLNLTAEEDMNDNEILRILKNNVSFLSSPWPREWFVTDLDIDDKMTKCLYVILRSKERAVRPTFITDTVKKMVNREWVFQVNKTKRVLKSNFRKHGFVSDYIRFGNRYENIPIPNPVKIYTRQLALKPVIIINRLYFCKQVELSQSEFFLSEKKHALFYINTQRFFFKGEFTLIENNKLEDIRARICIENSGFIEVGQSAVSYKISFLHMNCVYLSFFCMPLFSVLF